MTDEAHDHGADRDHEDRWVEVADDGREIDEWIEGITRRLWFVALESLPGKDGLWVGTEEELMAEL